MASNDMRDQAQDSRDIPPKGGHKSSNDETVIPGGHAQREGEGEDADEQLRDAGRGGSVRSDADNNVADVDRDGSGGGTGTRQQGGGASGEGMG